MTMPSCPSLVISFHQLMTSSSLASSVMTLYSVSTNIAEIALQTHGSAPYAMYEADQRRFDCYELKHEMVLFE